MMNKINTVIYTGFTNDLIRRVYEHKNHFVPGFTTHYRVEKLVYFEQFTDVRDAIERESRLKPGHVKRS